MCLHRRWAGGQGNFHVKTWFLGRKWFRQMRDAELSGKPRNAKQEPSLADALFGGVPSLAEQLFRLPVAEEATLVAIPA